MLNHPSFAERIAYGRPLETSDDPRIPVAPRPMTALLGRVLLAALFLASGLAKLADLDNVAGLMATAGLPAAKALALIAGLTEVAGAASLLFGFLTRLGALGLIAFLIPTTLVFHGFWNLEGAERHEQMIQLLKNLGVMGGLAAYVAFGAGRLSLDAVMRKPVQP